MEQQEQYIFSVGELTALIKEDLEASFSHVWVEGEISNLANHAPVISILA